jgi:hypothetical protein
MTQIVLNPEQLAQTASTLQNAAGEYQAIGAQVCGCDCGCMPADVAATVDAVTAEVRGGLSGIAGDISVQAADLAQRAGVDQNGGFSAVGAAWGGGQTIDVGGYSSDIFNQALQPVELPVGGYNLDIFSEATQPYVLPVGGYNLDIFSDAGNNGQTINVGGYSGYDLDIFSEATQPGTINIGGTDIFGQATGTGGYTLEITPNYQYTDAMAMLMSMAQANNDPWAMSMLMNNQTMTDIGTEIWTLSDGWQIEYNGMTFG